MSKAKEAGKIMGGGTANCAQTVLTMFCEDYGLPKDIARKLATGFGGGMARTGNTCGAVTGAFMVIGLREYPQITDPRQRVEKVYALVREFQDRFIAASGSIYCNELVGYDLRTPEGLQAARDNNAFLTVCPRFVENAVAILENL